MTAIIRKYNKAIDGLEESQEAFDSLTKQRTAAEIAVWTEQAEQADEMRATDIMAMDIYETTDQKGD